MLELKHKRATVGIINNRLETHGEDDVTAFDIPLDMLLNQDELEALVEHGSAMLFNDRKGVLEPAYPQFESFKLKHPIQAKHAVIFIGNGSQELEIEFEDVRLKTLVLTPINGGETQLSLLLQCRPPSKHMVRLINAQKTSVNFGFSDGEVIEKKAKQQVDLPLESADAKPKRARKGKNGEANPVPT